MSEPGLEDEAATAMAAEAVAAEASVAPKTGSMAGPVVPVAQRPFTRRVAMALAVVAAVFLFARLSPEAPVESTVRLALGQRAQGLREMILEYRDNGEGVRQNSFVFTDSYVAPREVDHKVRLAPKEYVLQISLRYEPSAQSGLIVTERRIRLEGGEYRVDLSREGEPR